jgi:hypothetical protein
MFSIALFQSPEPFIKRLELIIEVQLLYLHEALLTSGWNLKG